MGPVESIRRARKQLAEAGPREIFKQIVDDFSSHDLTVLATAIAFRALVAFIPGMLFVVALLGLLELGEVWRQDVAPDLRESVSREAYEFINHAIVDVLQQHRVFWLTIGLVIAVFAAGSVVRAVTRGVQRLYGFEERRSTVRRVVGSFGVGAVAALLLAAALVVTQIGELALERWLGDSIPVEVLGFVVRWSIAVVLMFGAIVVTIRNGPEEDLPGTSLTLGTMLTIGGWLIGSLAFGFYLSEIASVATVFGNLATIYIFVQYLFGLSAILLAGLSIDAALQNSDGRAQKG